MARICICDRCGAHIEERIDRFSRLDTVEKELNKISDSYFLYMGSLRTKKKLLKLDDTELYNYDIQGFDFDLCEDCRDSLYNWFLKKDEK